MTTAQFCKSTAATSQGRDRTVAAAMGWSRPKRIQMGRRQIDQSGGAVSLWVLLIVPVSVFAAVLATAVPQRLAAEAAMQEAADDVASFAVAWRDGYQMAAGTLPAFHPRCDMLSTAHETELQDLLQGLPDEGDPERQQKEMELAERQQEISQWSTSCEFFFEAIFRDLGLVGVESGSLQGFYSDSLGQSILADKVPCKVSEQVVVRDAVHAALTADWQTAGWASAQAWPDGVRLAAEAIGRLSQFDESATDPPCNRRLELVDRQGLPVWATNPDAEARSLVQSVPRTALSD